MMVEIPKGKMVNNKCWKAWKLQLVCSAFSSPWVINHVTLVPQVRYTPLHLSKIRVQSMERAGWVWHDGLVFLPLFLLNYFDCGKRNYKKRIKERGGKIRCFKPWLIIDPIIITRLSFEVLGMIPKISSPSLFFFCPVWWARKLYMWPKVDWQASWRGNNN